jgi:6-phosphogluconate dehydrogenase
MPLEIGMIGLRCGGPYSTAVIDDAVLPSLLVVLYERVSSCGEADFADRVLAAMRYEFSGQRDQAAAT